MTQSGHRIPISFMTVGTQIHASSLRCVSNVAMALLRGNLGTQF
jgi:hypothetical protein